MGIKSRIDARVGRISALLAGSLLLASACSNGEFPQSEALHHEAAAAPVCTPYAVASCVCGPGVTGVTACLPNGQGFGDCECADLTPVQPVMTGGTGAFPAPGGTVLTGGVLGSTGGVVQSGGVSQPASGGVQLTGGTPTPTGGVVQSGGISQPASGGVQASGGAMQTGGGLASGGMQATGGMEPVTGGQVSQASLAGDVVIDQVAIYQSVKISLAEGGDPVGDRNAPVIAGKAALLRVFVQPQSGFSARDLEAELTLSSNSAQVQGLTVQARVSGASSDADLGSTINFELPPEVVTTDLRYAVALRELGGGASQGAEDARARFPTATGQLEDLGAEDPGPLRVVLVPYRYLPDGSGRLPDLSASTVELYRSYVSSMYPVADIQFEVHASVDNYSGTVTADRGWENFLNDLCDLRTRENADPRVYYFGFMAPASSLRNYGSGVVGISYTPGPTSNFGRCSVGVGFGEGVSALTMAHEMGHALGLPHAPCGVTGDFFPYQGASIGSWGFNFRTRALQSPAEYVDLMSYCNPAFVSDYNYEKLFDRVRSVNTQFRRIGITPAAVAGYHRILQYDDGGLRLVGRYDQPEPPAGPEAAQQVELLDENGDVLEVLDALFLPTSEGNGGVWFIPDHGAAAVALKAGTVALQ